MQIGIGIGLPQLKQFKPAGAGGGGASPYDPASDAIFASFTIPPTTARKLLIDQCVRALKAAGVWAKLDALYVFSAADSQAAIINWVNPGTYNATLVGSPAFTPDVGFTGGVGKYIDSQFNPTTAPSPKFVQNSATVFAWNDQNVNAVGGLVGLNVNTGTIIYPRYSTDVFYARVNSGVNISLGSTDARGLWLASRTSASSTDVYRNGVAVYAGGLGASVAPVNSTIQFLANAAEYWGGPIRSGGILSQLSAAEQLALYNALANYQAGLAGTIMSSESVAIFNSFTVPATVLRRQSINTCVEALKTAGVWAKLDLLHVYAAADSQAGLVNWVQPGTYNGTLVNAPAFAVDVGFTGANTKQIDCGFNISTAPSPKFTQNSSAHHGWMANNAAIAASMIGTVASTALAPRWTDNNAYGRMNNAAGGAAVSHTDSVGFWSANRTASNLTTLYKNGVNVATTAQGASPPTNEVPGILAGNGAYWIGGQCSVAGIGAGLNATEALAFYNALAAYRADIATEKIVAAFTTPPPASRQSLIQNCVRSLVQAGVWDKLDAMYLFAAADSQAALINWVKPGTFNGTLVNAPTFAVDRGFTGVSTAYIDTNFNPTTAPTPKFVRDSATLFAQSSSELDSAGAIAGQNTAGIGQSVILPKMSGRAYGYANGSSGDNWANATSQGLFTITRRAATAYEMYRGATSIGTGTFASEAPLNSTIRFLHYSTGYWVGGECAGGGLSSQLNATEVAALNNALNTYIATARIISAFTTPPTEARKTLIANCVSSLISAGVWDKLDALYMFAAADSQAALINWKNPGTYNATLVNAPTFTADMGFTGAGTKYIDSGFNPTTAPTPKFTQNDLTVSAWSSASSGGSNGGIMGCVTASNTRLIPVLSGASFTFNLLNSANDSVANVNEVGFFSGSREAAATTRAYINGALVNTTGRPSVALPNENLVFLRRETTYWPGQISSGGFGSQLDVAGHLALNNTLRTYLTGVGVP